MTEYHQDVIEWLLLSDPSIRWQVMRDLANEPNANWQSERKKIEVEGWGKQLFDAQDPDGQWAGGSFAPKGATADDFKDGKQPFTATAFVLTELRDMGLDPKSTLAMRSVDLIRNSCKWDHDGQNFWDGEVEECINGRLVADGSYFGVDMGAVVTRLLETQLEDGGWNCEREKGSVRSSFDTTISVLEGLSEYEKHAGECSKSKEARKRGEEYLLTRHLFRRLTTGKTVKENYMLFAYPTRADYDVLRALDYFRVAAELDGTEPDARLKEAGDYVRSKQDGEGKWLLDREIIGPHWLEVNEGVGKPSKWITLRALRVLKWLNHYSATS